MTPRQILEMLDSYCTRTGLSPSTVCLRAVGNARLADRLRKRIESDDETGRRLIEFIRDNPAPGTPEGDAA